MFSKIKSLLIVSISSGVLERLLFLPLYAFLHSIKNLATAWMLYSMNGYLVAVNTNTENGWWQIWKKNICLKKIIIVDLRPKTRPCFFDIILMILWEKSLIKSFVVYSSVLKKLWSFKVLNPSWVTSYRWMCITLHPWFSLHIFVDYIEK